jgi:hypothetical protein
MELTMTLSVAIDDASKVAKQMQKETATNRHRKIQNRINIPNMPNKGN